MGSIVDNQRKAFQARAEDSATHFAAALLNVPPVTRAALIASVAHHSQTPIDVTLFGARGDGLDAAQILDGDLADSDDGTWAWKIGSGCSFIITEEPL